MRTPNTFQIGSTTYTTREYCNARGITDNATILKIQWRINTYIRRHTLQQTIEELDRLTLHPTHSKRETHTGAGWLDEQRQEGIRPWLGARQERISKMEDTLKQERIKAQQENKAREAATNKMITQQQNGETATRAIDQRELLKRSEPSDKIERYIATDLGKELYAKTQANKEATTAMKQSWIRRALERTSPEENIRPLDILQSPKNQPNDIKTAITQCAEAIQTVNRLEKELGEAQNALERLKTITANLLNGETSDDRTKRFNQ